MKIETRLGVPMYIINHVHVYVLSICLYTCLSHYKPKTLYHFQKCLVFKHNLIIKTETEMEICPGKCLSDLIARVPD